MNTKQFEHLNKLKSVENEDFGKSNRTKSTGLTNANSGILTTSEKHLRIKLHELEELNANLEKLVDQRSRKLNELVTTNGKFLSIIAHDLRSPFSSILSILELLKLSLKSSSIGEIEKYVDIVYDSANNALKLLDELLIWVISQNKEKSFNPVKINLYELLSEEIEIMIVTAWQKQISMKQSISPNLNVTADIQMIKTILRNLISNAIKYTNTNGVISINAVRSKQFIEVAVIDNGIGLSSEAQKSLFKMDTFHSTAGTNNEKGTGLGLLLCKEFVEAHGGNIWLESEPGKGSRFAFTLPEYI
jgi:signal transduction histidine kinase